MAANLFVNRLYVLTEGGLVAYDEQFHHGVNIIRGENSSGKSTITHLLFYALGGEYTNFVAQARSCLRVMVEVDIDGAVLTLSRPIEKDDEGRVLPKRGMTVYWGSIDQTLASNCESNYFGYSTTSNKRSFSNELFEVMGMPIVQGDSNITMHQLLRLLYIDQESPTSSLFYYEQFDKQTTREAVADLLLGIFDSELYSAKLKKKELESAITEIKSDIRSVESSLPKDQRSKEHIESLIKQKRLDIEQLEEDIHRKRQGEEVSKRHKSETMQQMQLVKALAHDLDKAERDEDILSHDIEDTKMFIDELQRKQKALQNSVSTRQILGNLQLEYCPECLSPLPNDVPEGTCRLCKSPIKDKLGITQAKRLIAELSFQIKESASIHEQDIKRLDQLKAQRLSLRRKHRSARKTLNQMLDNVRSTAEEEIEDLIYNKGMANGELLQLYDMMERAEYYEQLIERKEQLESDLSHEERLIQAKTAGQESRRAQVLSKIQEHGVYFLQHDKERQRDFVNSRPSDFHVDFANNLVYLSDKYSKYSASSAFFLKIVARFSLFFASLDIPWMRYPHFIFADNMEDKGIEKERAQQFQQTLIERLKSYPTDSYQLIYTTSYITPELDQSDYVVGDHYTMRNKSLKNV